MRAALTCFRRAETASGVRSSTGAPDRRLLACAACRRQVTSAEARIEVAASHEHTFANPHGFVFRIGCFSRAECALVGPRSAEWSWFPPHLWQLAHCPACASHLGWRFTAEASAFYGLVLDRLIEIEAPS